MWQDPIVAEVRRARLEIEKECGGDFDQIYERALEVQKNSTAKIVSRPDPARSRHIGGRSGSNDFVSDSPNTKHPAHRQIG